MMLGTIQNRETFLNQIASRLGRERLSVPIARPVWKYQPQEEVLKGATADELVEVLKTHCLKIHTSLVLTDLQSLPETLEKTVADYGNESVVTWRDQRFSDWGLDPLLKDTLPRQNIDVYEWDHTKGQENIRQAEKANIGITISEVTLAESGTVVLFSDKDKGRTVSFLPKSFICLVPKSTLVPRMTQAAKIMRERYLQGEMASCVNFITGPSNSADIELNLVVGVHGPVRATYILIDDL